MHKSRVIKLDTTKDKEQTYISMWFDDLLVTYVHDEASPKIIIPLQAQQPLMVVYHVSACLEPA